MSVKKEETKHETKQEWTMKDEEKSGDSQCPPDDFNSDDDESEVANTRPKASSGREPSSDEDLFKEKFARRPDAGSRENVSMDRWADLPNGLKKKIGTDFEESVLDSIPRDISTCLASK